MKRDTFTIIFILVAAISLWQLYQFRALGELTGSVLAQVSEPTSVASSPQPCTDCSLPGVEAEQVTFKPERIVISKEGINLPVVAVALKNGTWPVNPGVANFAEETSWVNGQNGNTGIFAHDRADGFTNIKYLVPGDQIQVYGQDHQATYVVTNSSIVKPTQVDVFYPTSAPTLTLVTCNGVFSQKRYIVTAQLKEIK